MARAFWLAVIRSTCIVGVCWLVFTLATTPIGTALVVGAVGMTKLRAAWGWTFLALWAWSGLSALAEASAERKNRP